MKNQTKIQSLSALLMLVVLASAACAKTKQQLALERDTAKFWQTIKASKKFGFVSSVKAGSTISGIQERAIRENPFVMVNDSWKRFPEKKKRQVAAELFNRWLPYCVRSKRYAAIYFQTKPGADPVAQCSEDDGCALAGDRDE